MADLPRAWLHVAVFAVEVRKPRVKKVVSEQFYVWTPAPTLARAKKRYLPNYFKRQSQKQACQLYAAVAVYRLRQLL